MELLEKNDMIVEKEPVYAGFWKRFAAYLLDGIFLGIPLAGITVLVFLFFFGATGFFEGIDDPDYVDQELTNSQLIGMFAAYGIVVIINLLASILYYAGFHSSKMQATPGKRILGLKVTDLNGNRISFWRALGRLLAMSFLSTILMIGYIIAAFTEKKQALHDLIAGTIVVKR
ncbi:RDD family protein [Falsibacillus pallidus]|uniref:Putative RDD family membrane protein YckC n=1 Tax=Falsibacillus pallidus TaxID=493781 RepID=A0A370H0S9_9BACI|nr:RDD family protein [Falsibacillus pallidus]RDI47653.1 putative RDD family membrane protein YckC [Falsibacillus pallidus]